MELLKMLYDSFYEPLPETTLKQSIKENHRQLIDRLEKPERQLVLRIIDAQDQITEDLSTDSFIAGFQLAWRLASELHIREKERPTLVQKSRLDALCVLEEGNDEEGEELHSLV
ncbi:MAG TPA: hypothetical protein IAC97_05150 [Candidatus Pelethousia gallinarum]|nr:hypothetical protein [Candidatus Pelethousia gallinarum]